MKLNRWFYAFLALTLALVASLSIVGCGGKKDPKPTVIPEGPETGVYYYDANGDEYVVSLNNGNKFAMVVEGVTKVGEYTTAEDGSFVFTFTNDAVTTASATISEDVLTLTYNGAEMRFLKKIIYTVNFESNGGSSVASVSVMNGRTVDKPDDPTLASNVFLGWYTDTTYTTAFDFSSIITANTTVYAQWAPYADGQTEYTVDLVNGTETVEVKTTIGGKIYGVPTLQSETATFGGWWISAYEDGEKLTYQYTEGMVFTANTTLFAVWNTTEGSKVAAPAARVDATSIKWDLVPGALTYKVTVTDQAGNVIVEDTVGAGTKTVDFASYPAGDYVIEVTSIAAVAENNSVATVRYYRNKALNRVSVFNVIDPSTLVFNAVENATKYLITVDCGNDNHNHVDFDNGNSTYFNFANCAMQEGGIVFTVTAVAEGYASTKSEAFVYNRLLGEVTGLALDAATETLTWNAVENAASYAITVVAGNGTFTTTVNYPSVSLKQYAAIDGGIQVTVTPVTKGYNSPEAAEYVYEKTTLAAPTGLTITGTVLAWDAVDGATSYSVKVGAKNVPVTTNSLDLSTVDVVWDTATSYDISVMAIGAANSLYSDAISAGYYTLYTSVSYANGVVSWKPVIGATSYQVQVNSGAVITVDSGNSVAVTLTQAGVNKIAVRYMTEAWSDWSKIEVYAHTITFDTRSGSGIAPQYKAVGDPIVLPTDTTREGFDFSAWYNTIYGPESNGSEYTDTVFAENGDIVLYAYWTPKTYTITLWVDDTVTNVVTGDVAEAVYTKNYTIVVPVSTDEARGYFSGWYTLPGGAGVQLTDKDGNSVAPYGWTRNTEAAYPFFETGICAYELQSDGTYLAKKGEGIDTVSHVTIASEYKGAAVTGIIENGFAYSYELESITFPNTFTLVGTGAFNGCSALKEINVTVVEGSHEVFYWSEEGVLMRKDSGVNYLELVPRAKTGSYTVSNTVDNIRARAFYYSSLTSVEIPSNVTYIAPQAFYTCRELVTVKFTYASDLEEGATVKPLTLESNSFYNCPEVKEIYLPARLENFYISMLDAFSGLQTIDVEEGNPSYSDVSNMLCNATGDTILYCPKTLSGVFEVPVGITGLGNGVFQGRTAITKIIIPNYVTNIGNNAFQGCSNVTEITFKGNRTNALTIGSNAFAGCNATTVLFLGNEYGEMDAAITIGSSAFANNAITTLTFGDGTNIAAIGGGAFAGAQIKETGWGDGSKVIISQIGANAFSGCTEITSVVIPASTQKIGDGAFEGCAKIRSIEFAPNGQNVQFGTYVFSGCVLLKEIHLPANVTSFDGSVFDGCDSITAIIVDEDNEHLKSIDGVLYDYDVTEIMYYPKGKDGDLSKLPISLTKIGASVFQNNPKITTVILNAGITTIGEKAFNNCINLTSITFNSTELTIGNYAFANCAGLETITLPEGTTSIGTNAFYRTPLTQVNIPSTVTLIGDNAFAYTYIETIHIPVSVVKIGNGAFNNCLNLEEVTFDMEDGAPLVIGSAKTSPGFLETDEGKWQEYHDYKGAQGTFTQSPKLSSIDFPARLQTIADYTFYNAENLTAVTFGTTDASGLVSDSQLALIGKFAFYNTGITEVVFGSISTIDTYAFYGTGLTSVYFPNTTAAIQKYAFANTALTAVSFEIEVAEDETVPGLSIEQYAFANAGITTVNLPARITNLGGTFKAANSPSLPGVAYVFQGATELEAINIEDGGTKYSSVGGVVYNADQTTLYYAPSGKTGEYVVPKTVTKVESLAFIGSHLSKVTFEEYDEEDANYGAALLEIGSFSSTTTSYGNYSVFGGNTELGISQIVEVNLPSHLKVLKSFAFAKAGALTTVTFNMDASIELADSAFEQSATITALHLPVVTSLGGHPFKGMTALEEITFTSGSNITKFGDFTFNGCSSLKEFVLPASVTYVGWLSFSGCSSLTSWTVEEGSQLTEFDDGVFSSCDSLTYFKMPDTVTKIGTDLFNYCENLETIEISANIAKLSSGSGSPFGIYDLHNFKEIIVPEENLFLESVDGVVYDEALTTVILYPVGKDSTGWTLPATVHTIAAASFSNVTMDTFNIPKGIETIETGAFKSSKINVINIPSTVKTIAADAFSSSTVTEINIAEGSMLESIGNSAFYATKISTFVVPDTVKSIGNSAFSYSTNLKTVFLPQNANYTALADSLFRGCSALETVVIPQSVRTIGQYAFYEAGIKYIEIPESVVSIGREAFKNTKKLQTITFQNGSQLQTIDQGAFQNSAITSFEMPDNATTLGNAIFDGCTNLSYFKLAAALTEVPDNFLNGITAITEIVLPANLNKIGEGAFAGTSITSVTIPATVTEIGNYAFDGCASLAEVNFEVGIQITKLGNANEEAAIFRGTTSLTTFNLPASVEELGGNIFQGSGLTSIVLNSSMKEISQYAFADCLGITEIVIPDHVSTVGEHAFDGCINATTLEIPLGVETLGSYAFANCTGLTSANIPASVTNMGENPFSACANIPAINIASDNEAFFVADNGVVYDKDVYTLIYYPAALVGEVVIPETVRVLAGGAFAGSSITTITIPDTIKEISANAFKDCASLTEVIISKSVTKIAEYAFNNCDALETISIPATVEEIGYRAFYNCDNLANVIFEKRNAPLTLGEALFENCLGIKSINLPNTITKLPAYAFAGSGLEELVLPESITDVTATGIFKGCPYLRTVTFHENVGKWLGDEVFMDCASLEYVDFSAAVDLKLGSAKDGKNWIYPSERAFMNTPSLVTVYFAEGQSGLIPKSCFENSGLQYLDFSMTAFYGCWARAFANCTNMHTIVMCEDFYDIEVEAFLNCSALDGIIHVPYCWLYGNVFSGCTNIDEIHFSGGLDWMDAPGNFQGWTSEQKIFLYDWTADDIDGDGGLSENCEAEIIEM